MLYPTAVVFSLRGRSERSRAGGRAPGAMQQRINERITKKDERWQVETENRNRITRRWKMQAASVESVF